MTVLGSVALGIALTMGKEVLISRARLHEQTYIWLSSALFISITPRAQDSPSTLQELPVHLAGGHSECSRVEHGHTS